MIPKLDYLLTFWTGFEGKKFDCPFSILDFGKYCFFLEKLYKRRTSRLWFSAVSLDKNSRQALLKVRQNKLKKKDRKKLLILIFNFAGTILYLKLNMSFCHPRTSYAESNGKILWVWIGEVVRWKISDLTLILHLVRGKILTRNMPVGVYIKRFQGKLIAWSQNKYGILLCFYVLTEGL